MPRCYRLSVLACLLAAWCGGSHAPAQEFRVYTSVHAGEAAARRVVARSLTLFHAGRVYDHMEDVGELVIFEPLQQRFILIRDSLATELSLDELQKMLSAATASAEEYAAELAASREPQARLAHEQLVFQLRPRFETHFDANAARLTLTGSQLRYVVKTSPAAPADVLEAYLRYADWTARLNTVLHSQGTFPGPREVLNRTLAEKQLLPVSVTLQGRTPRELQLVAEHEFRWQLQTIDRDLIHQWERLRESDRLAWVSFREYHQKLLAAAKRRGL